MDVTYVSLSTKIGIISKDMPLHLSDRGVGVRDVARSAQVQFLNRHRAARADDVIVLDGAQLKVKGTGKWKQLTASEILRCVFTSPAQTVASVAMRIHASGRHILDWLSAASAVMRTRQRDAVDVLLAQPLSWLIFQLQWDETQFMLVPGGDKGRGTFTSTMASHAKLLWSLDAVDVEQAPTVFQEEFVCPAMVLASTAAPCLWYALLKILPESLGRILYGDVAHLAQCRVVALNLGSDHAAPNLRHAGGSRTVHFALTRGCSSFTAVTLFFSASTCGMFVRAS